MNKLVFKFDCRISDLICLLRVVFRIVSVIVVVAQRCRPRLLEMGSSLSLECFRLDQHSLRILLKIYFA